MCFVLTGKINFTYQKDFQIDKIWSQAYSLYKSGFKYELTGEDLEENEEVNSQFIVRTPEMELIQKHYCQGSKEDPFMTATDIAEELSYGSSFYKGNNTAVGKAMKLLGFKKEGKYLDGSGFTVKGYFVKKLTS